jgi:hypothetical protein
MKKFLLVAVAALAVFACVQDPITGELKLGAIIPPQIQTTTATPVTVIAGVSVDVDSAVSCSIYVFAQDHAGDVARWAGDLLLLKRLDGVLIMGGSLVKSNTAGASTWSATLVNQDGVPWVQLTGVAGVTIDWMVTNDQCFGMIGPFVG